MHSFMGEITIHIASFPTSHDLVVVCFLVVFFFSSCIHRGPFAAWHAMVKAYYPTNIILDIIEKGIGRVSS